MTCFLFKIPGLLFEPIAVITIVASFAAFIIYYKKHDRLYWIITLTVGYMLIWRLSVHSLIVSSRYASIILYPAIILSAWLICHLNVFVKYIGDYFRCRNNPFFKELLDRIPACIVFLLTLACVIKTLHFNPYVINFLQLTSSIHEKDAVIFADKEESRIFYYSQKKVTPIVRPENMSVSAYFDNKLPELKNKFEPCYFFIHKPPDEQDVTNECLVRNSKFGSLEFVQRLFTSRRNNKEIVLYRFIPSHPNVEIWDNDIPDLSTKNLCRNGGFEASASDSRKKYLQDEFRKLNNEIYASDKIIFPDYWSFDITYNHSKTPPLLSLTSDSPLSGKCSLLMDSRESPFPARFHSQALPNSNYSYSGFIKCSDECKSEIFINNRFWDPKQQKTIVVNSINFVASPGKIYHFKGETSSNLVPNGDAFFFDFITVGCILIDNIEITAEP